jgi:hypothetical protein
MKERENMIKTHPGIQGTDFSKVWIIALAVLLLLASTAKATLTTIQTSNEPALSGAGGILDQLYGLENLTRVQDNGSVEPVDQYWTFTGEKATITGRAKYAGFPHQFGILAGDSGWDYDIGITTGAKKSGLYGEAKGMPIPSVTRTSAGEMGTELFRFGLRLPSKRGYIWSSVPTDNQTMPGGFAGDGSDHMVTWQITGNTGHERNRIGSYVLAWEDLDAASKLGSYDADYNDLVVEVSGAMPIPEPASMSLLACMGFLYFRVHRKKQ